MNSSIERTVTHLQNLYSVVVGLALAATLMKVLGSAPGVSVNVAALPTAIAFVATLIPFYHGALRHLDATYLEGDLPVTARSFMADWVLLFVEGCGLLALGLSVDDAQFFTLVLIAFLLFDAVWAIAFAPKGERPAPELRWARINVVTAPALAVILASWSLLPSEARTGVLLGLAVMLVAIIRTVLDYRAGRDFYLPFVRN